MSAETPASHSLPPIVVGFDGLSQGVDALHLALAIAGDETEIVACCIFPLELGEHGPAKREDAERRLRVARDLLAERPYARVAVRPAFSPAAGLHEECEESGAGMLVVGSSHRGPVGRIVPGSVTRQALHAAPCAVAVAPLWLQAREPIRFAEIGVGFDGGPSAVSALKRGAALARDHAGHLHVVSVAETGATDWTSAWVWPPAPDATARAELESDAHDALAALAGGIESAVEIVGGSAAEELALASARLDLLLVGSRGYGPIRRTLLGSVSGRVAESAACPVIVVPRTRDRAPMATLLAAAAVL